VESTGEQVTIDWHGHNDRGLGLINAIAAIEAGVHVVHGAALGIGERCGNTAMDQLIVNLSLMGYFDAGIDLTLLPKYIQKVSECCCVPVPKNYPVFGPDAFETATGVHAAAVIKALKKGDSWLANRVYSGVPADVFGLGQSITIGPMSGRSNVIFWLNERGLNSSAELVDRIFNKAKQSATILTRDEIMAEVEAPTSAS
jgi:2-isopropylmalate synthase